VTGGAQDTESKETDVIEDRDKPTTTAPGAPASTTTGGIEATAREAGDVARERAGELRETARQTMHDARDAVEARSEAAKGQAAQEIERTAHGLEAAANEMEGSRLQQELLREAADGLKQISRAVSGKSVGEMVEELADFGRRNPLAFLGGAALAGFALARFARAGAPVGVTHDYSGPQSAGYSPASAGQSGPQSAGYSPASADYSGQRYGGTTDFRTTTPGGTPGAASGSEVGGNGNV
jgi:hypothetical protein